MAPSAHWTAAEEDALLDFFVENLAEAGDGGNFRSATLQRTALHITHLHERGAVKTAKMCRNKLAAFRKLYRVVLAIMRVSGWTWSSKTGASITPATASSWDDYVKHRPEAKPFRNKGWPHFDKVALLMPSTTPDSNVFHPTATPPSAPEPSTSDSPPAEDLEAPTAVSDSPDPKASDDEEAASPAPIAVRKCAREPATPTPPVKRTRSSQGAAALQDLSSSLTQFTSAIAAALAPPPTSDERQADAIKKALALEKPWVTDRQFITLLELFRVEKSAVDIYLALAAADEPYVRKEWVRVQLERLGAITFPNL